MSLEPWIPRSGWHSSMPKMTRRRSFHRISLRVGCERCFRTYSIVIFFGLKSRSLLLILWTRARLLASSGVKTIDNFRCFCCGFMPGPIFWSRCVSFLQTVIRLQPFSCQRFSEHSLLSKELKLFLDFSSISVEACCELVNCAASRSSFLSSRQMFRLFCFTSLCKDETFALN